MWALEGEKVNAVEQGPLARALVELTGAMVDEIELFGWLDRLVHRSGQLTEADACGGMITDRAGDLALAAASEESDELRELLTIQVTEGPGMDSFRSKEAVSCPDLDEPGEGWPRFSPWARALGYRSVYAFPIRVGGDALGALTFLYFRPRAMSGADQSIAHAFADLAAIGVLHERSTTRRETEIEQLKVALNSRVLIEQAKGVLAERYLLGVDEAFSALRSYARSRNLRLHDVARDVVDHNITLGPDSGFLSDRKR